MNKRLMMLLFASGCLAEADLGTETSELKGGTVVPVGELEAVVTHGCTATLITDTAVLTAAHCVCDRGPPMVCDATDTVIFKQVFGVNDDPSTPFDERTTRSDRSITAKVYVHPDYDEFGWATNDYAILRLDRHASDEVAVAPIRVEMDRPEIGDAHTLVGYGLALGENCDSGSGVKRKGTLELDDIKEYPDYDDPRAGATLIFEDDEIMTCYGDSGGPVINSAGKVAGVASVGHNAGNAAYDATFFAADWIADKACPYFEPARAETAFCDDPLCPCAPAEGDCDDNSECELGSSCVNNIGALVGMPAGHDVCWSNDHVVTGYAGTSYTGASQMFPIGTWTGTQLAGVGDNAMSSIRLKPGYLARICDTTTGATCANYTSSSTSLGTLDNRASYVRVSAGVTLYRDTSFGGTAQTLGIGNHGSSVLAGGIGNDAPSSLIAAPGLSIRICSENGGWGNCQDVGGRLSSITSPLKDNVSNVEVRAGVTLYRDIDFGGTQQSFPAGTFTSTNMTVIGNDQVSSMVVAPGYVARICAHASGAAPCADYTGWVSFVGEDMNDRTSWIRITAQ